MATNTLMAEGGGGCNFIRVSKWPDVACAYAFLKVRNKSGSPLPARDVVISPSHVISSQEIKYVRSHEGPHLKREHVCMRPYRLGKTRSER